MYDQNYFGNTSNELIVLSFQTFLPSKTTPTVWGLIEHLWWWLLWCIERCIDSFLIIFFINFFVTYFSSSFVQLLFFFKTSSVHWYTAIYTRNRKFRFRVFRLVSIPPAFIPIPSFTSFLRGYWNYPFSLTMIFIW